MIKEDEIREGKTEGKSEILIMQLVKSLRLYLMNTEKK